MCARIRLQWSWSTLYDPWKLAKETEEMVARGRMRKYYRGAIGGKWYGGIASAYCCGCNLRCVFCWSGYPRDHPDKIGDFYSPEHVFNQLVEVATKRGYNQIRITGNEPTIGKEHLFQLLEQVDQSRFLFILETNGMLIGRDRNFAEQLARFKNLHVRVSLKATNPEEFSKLTGANPKSFQSQLAALKNLLEAGVSFHPAIMTSFTTAFAIQELNEALAQIHSSLAENLEKEHIILYPPVAKRLKEAGIEPVRLTR